MIRVSAHFVWPSLTLSWSAERSDATLSVAAMLRRAERELQDQGATVELAPEADRLRFSSGWPVMRTWLRMVAGGSVHVQQKAEGVFATAQASLWPLALGSVPLFALLVATRFHVLVDLFAVVLLGGLGLAAYFGLRNIARATLTL
jgi:hypothetical protein